MAEQKDDVLYYVEARDVNGDIASSGRVTAERLERAKRLFSQEGWAVTVRELAPGEDPTASK